MSLLKVIPAPLKTHRAAQAVREYALPPLLALVTTVILRCSSLRHTLSNCNFRTDTSVLIATRSHLLPLSPAGTSQFDSMDLSIPVNLTQQHSSGPETNDWEAWGEESIIELCEVQLKFDGVQMSRYTGGLSARILSQIL